MKIIKNNQSSTLLFIKSNYSFDDIISARLTQLGGSGYFYATIDEQFSDCQTHSLVLSLAENQLSNGLYILELLDSINVVINSSTVKIEGYDEENPRAFIVKDDIIDSEQIILN